MTLGLSSRNSPRKLVEEKRPVKEGRLAAEKGWPAEAVGSKVEAMTTASCIAAAGTQPWDIATVQQLDPFQEPRVGEGVASAWKKISSAWGLT